MLELLSPASSAEAVRAAVQNGADSVAVSFGSHLPQAGAQSFTPEEFAESVRYCHIRGVRVYIYLNNLLTDEQMEAAAEDARMACRLGADAAIVRDPGLIAVLRQVTPDLPLHASMQMDIHDLEGVRRAEALGCSRVCLSPELSLRQIGYICANSPIETEVFVHGPLCVSRSGQCLMGAFSDGGSASRGACSSPCHLNYGFDCKGRSYPLSLRDRCLIDHIPELEACGVTAVRIEGLSRRPEHSGIVTSVYSSVIKQRRRPGAAERRRLMDGADRDSFTAGYLDGTKGMQMFGNGGVTVGNERNYAEIRRAYINNEVGRVGVRFCALIRPGEPCRLAAEDENGNIAIATGVTPGYSASGMDERTLDALLSRLGGTPYRYLGSKNHLSPGLYVSPADINSLRHEVLARLSDIRARIPERSQGIMPQVYPFPNRGEEPELSVSVLHARSLSEELAALEPALLYLPLEELISYPAAVRPFLERGVTVAAALPRVICDNDSAALLTKLERARSLGIRQVLTGNPGHAAYARSLGFTIRGDLGLNVFNSRSLERARDAGFCSAILSPELNFEQIAAISKCIDTEVAVYGRVPLMVTENCIIKNRTGVCSCDNVVNLVDHAGARYPLEKESGCRNLVLSPRKIFLADRREDWISLGLRWARLNFTTENPRECLQIMRSYLGKESFIPADFTRGLYYSGME